MTQTDEKPKGQRVVSYELKTVDELPPDEPRAGRISQHQRHMETIRSNSEMHGKWHRVAAYEKPGAATTQANVLRDRHGVSPSIDGWEFATRKEDETDPNTGRPLTRGLYVRYDPSSIQPGALDQWREHIAKRDAERAERAKQRQAEKEADGGGNKRSKAKASS